MGTSLSVEGEALRRPTSAGWQRVGDNESGEEVINIQIKGGQIPYTTKWRGFIKL